MSLKSSGSPVHERMWSYVARMFLVRQSTIAKGIFIALMLSVISLLCLSYYGTNFNLGRLERSPPQPTIKCQQSSEYISNLRPSPINDHSSAAQLRIDNRALILVETQFTTQSQEIVSLLESNRIRYKIELAGKSLPYLTHNDKGKFGVIIFERIEGYLNMDKWNRQLLDKYCRDYNVGIIAFTHALDAVINAQVADFPLSIHTKLELKDFRMNPKSPVLRLTRAGETLYGRLPGVDWTVFVPNHTTYEPLAYAKMHTLTSPEEITNEIGENSVEEFSYITAIQDLGLYDGIQRVIFGNGFVFWLHRLLFLDALSYLSHGKFSITLDRHVLIDIDDIFVGKVGTRMKPEDVTELVAAQGRLAKNVEGFKFNLGFSGKYYKHGTREEDKGDEFLLEHRHNFWWFPHMWKHFQPHKFENYTNLEKEMLKNKGFAQEHDIPVNQSYAVSPHHSGVYPVHEELYDAWKNVWKVRATSTEEYPRLRPARHRRGFVHRGIMVLPRQTCGLFTHTIFLDKYPGGQARLEHSIRGGELFQSFLYNPVNVFMTHLSNYGNDRLALYTFESVVKFVQCWTNLRLKTLPPVELAKLYFNLYPDEGDPVWRNPCDDKRHIEIWSSKKTCKRLPDFLVIGPQKTGTTALYSFLGMHPFVSSNYNSPATFEEVQFFNGRNYYKGLDWYMEFFPHPNQTLPNRTLFEKSANYFDSEVVPERAHALLPRARLICILINPAKRAYSWYQHQRAHKDEVAAQYSFYDVVSAGEDSARPLRELKHRCLNPGLYAQHLENWLDFYEEKQLLILDGDRLKSDPVSVMRKVQTFLHLDPLFDYSKRLKYNPKKGFYCQIVSGDHTKCLGRSKGRHYPPMDPKAEIFLRNFYRKHNIALSKLLMKINQPIPDWLEEELSDLR